MKLTRGNKPATAGELRPTDPFSAFTSEMDGLFDRFFRGAGPEGVFGAGAVWGPSVDIVDGEKEVVVRADLPGVEPRDLDIYLSGNALTIAGEKKESHEEKTKAFHRSERRVGSFRRTLDLPAAVDPDKVSADYAKGVLTIRLEKAESSRPRKIAVK